VCVHDVSIGGGRVAAAATVPITVLINSGANKKEYDMYNNNIYKYIYLKYKYLVMATPIRLYYNVRLVYTQ